MTFVGIDLHTTCITATFLGTGSIGEAMKITKKSYPLDELGMKAFILRLSSDMYAAVEATSNSFWFYELISPHVKEFYVLDTHKMRLDGNKTDKIDSEKIARCISYCITTGEKEKIPAVYIPNKEVQEMRSLFTTYRLTKKCATQLKNNFHGLVKQQGFNLKKGALNTKKGRKNCVEKATGSVFEVQARSLMKQIEMMKQETEELQNAIINRGYMVFREEINLLISIRGISAFLAIAIMTDVATVDRFKTAKQFCSYLRTAPTIKGSNETIHLGRVNKRSRVLTCSLMTQSVMHLQGANSHFKDFYSRVKKGKSSGKARIAIIRKMQVAIFYMLKRKELFHEHDEILYEIKKKRLEETLKKQNGIEKKLA
jgi:transposase